MATDKTHVQVTKYKINHLNTAQRSL